MGGQKQQGHGDATAPAKPTSYLEAWNAGINSVHAERAAVVDPRIPNVPRDVNAIDPWVDTVPGAPSPTKPAAAPTKPASRNEQLVDMQATAHAAALSLTRHTTKDPGKRWQFLNTLDRIDDPVLREKTLLQFQAQTGMPLNVFITNTEWHSDRDQEQALALISPERGAAERELQGMSPEDRKKLGAKANEWSMEVLHVTRVDDADSDEKSQKLSNVLGKRTPAEVEAIRASVRYNTRGKSLYQEIDRSQSGGNEDEALAGTTGNKVFAASVGITNADGNAERIKEIVGGLSAAERAGLVLSNGPLGASAITSSVHESQRDEVQKLLTGTNAAAEGAHFADLFKDPTAGIEVDGVDATEQGKQSFSARQPENIIKELRSKSPAELEAARTTWDKENPGRSWDQMIQERFGSGDPTTFLRINALAHGNKVEERAYALRDGIRKNNQAQIEAALANPDTSNDPKKVAAAQAEKRELEARVRELDALGQRATAMMMGQDPAQAAGRDLDAQLTDHYKDAVAKNPHTTDPAELLVLSADPEGSKAKRQAKANEDTYATDELKTQGKLSATTQIRRAETKGDTQRKAELLENLETGKELAEVKATFKNRYNKDPLEEPDVAEIDSTSAFLKSTGDSRPLSEIKGSVADKMQSSLELRVQDVGDYGVKAERPEFLQHVLQKRLYAKQRSESNEESEDLRARWGFNVGTEDLAQAQLANQADMFTKPAGPYGTGTRELKDGVDREQFTQGDKALTKSLDVQREEKIKHAERLANTFVTIAKIGAILIAQPELVMLIDLAANLGGMAIKQSAGGSDVDVSADMAMMAVDVIADGLGVGVARMGGAGKAIATEGAAHSAVHVGEKTAEELVEHGVTTEAKSEIVGAGAKAAAGESSVLTKELAAASDTGGAALLAKADTGALALAQGKLANEGVSAGTSAVSHGSLVANMGVNSFGSVLGGAVQGESSDDLLIGLGRMLAGALLPGRLAGSMQKAIGTGTKFQRAVGTLIGMGADVGTSAAISGSVVDAVGNRVQHHVGGHANAHADDDRYARRTSHDTDAFGHHADDAVHPTARHIESTDGLDAATRLPHDSEPAPHDDAHASDQGTAGPRMRAPRQIDPAQRAATDVHMRKYGHPGSEVHSHFLGIASTADFAKQMGTEGKPLSNEEMLAKMQQAVREDADYKNHYSRNEQDEQVFDHSGAGKGGRGGDAFENIKAIEDAQAKIAELRKLPASPENEATIQKEAANAVRAAMETTQQTPFDGAYSVRDTLVKKYIDPQVAGAKTPYTNYTKMALAALARDGVTYSEQSQSVNKLKTAPQGGSNFPDGVTNQVLAEMNAERAARGEPPIATDVRFLAMLHTRFLGEEGSYGAGTAKEWADQLELARQMMKRGDVIGMDFASPETTTMAKGGAQLRQRVREAGAMLKEEGEAAGRKLVWRPHVGEGYVEMPINPATGKPMDHDRDNNREHYQKAQDNMRALVDAVDAMTKPGPKGEPPIYDPKNPAFEIRFGHSTHASPEIAADMARLGIVAEVNLGSNVISGSLQDNQTNPVGRDADGRLQSLSDHSLLTLAATGVPILLSTDGPAVMQTSLANEYVAAKAAIDRFRGGADSEEQAQGFEKIPVTRQTYLDAHPDVDAATAQPPYELSYAQLPEAMKRNIDDSFERMVADAADRKRAVEAADAKDIRRSESTKQ